MPLRRLMLSHIQTLYSIFLRYNWGWLTLVFSSLYFQEHSLSFKFSADADVGFPGNVTRDGEREASMVPSSSHSLEFQLCFFFVNYWDVCWSPCRPCCSCSQGQAEHWLWTGTRSDITSAWLFSAAWQSHVILFWQGMEVRRLAEVSRKVTKEKKKERLWQLRRSFPVTFIWPAMLMQCLAFLQLS